MTKELQEIYEDKIIHSSFLDKSAVEKCMKESYDLGRSQVLNWLKNMSHLCDNVDYIIEEFKNQHKNF